MYFYYGAGIIMLPVLIFAFYCQIKVNSNFKKYGNIRNSRGLTGAQAASQLLQMNGVTDVSIKRTSGNLTDYYNPNTKEIYLSQNVYDSASIAAVGIACHEAGHACQHAEGYLPLKVRNLAIPATRIGSMLGVPLAIIGMFISFEPLIYVGIILYAAVALFQLLTLPVEFNASARALKVIEAGDFLDESERRGAKKVLTAAAMTYVAALASALATLFRLFAISNRRR